MPKYIEEKLKKYPVLNLVFITGAKAKDGVRGMGTVMDRYENVSVSDVSSKYQHRLKTLLKQGLHLGLVLFLGVTVMQTLNFGSNKIWSEVKKGWVQSKQNLPRTHFVGKQVSVSKPSRVVVTKNHERRAHREIRELRYFTNDLMRQVRRLVG